MTLYNGLAKIIKTKSLLPAVALTVVLLKGSAKLGVLPNSILLVLKKKQKIKVFHTVWQNLAALITSNCFVML